MASAGPLKPPSSEGADGEDVELGGGKLVPLLARPAHVLLDNLGREDETVAELLAETKVNQVSPDPWIWLGRLALAKRNGAQTIPYAQEAVKRDPNDGLPYLILGKGYILKQQWSDAFEALSKAEKLAPDSYEIHYALATVYGAMNDPASALAERKLFAQSYSVLHQKKDGEQ